jgi:hypothetical protein|tara:strand:+ start:441 stop:1679 length:1239 start_codon:yes stop_codon:yes gene_type:complete
MAGNRVLRGEEREYPKGLRTIEYASYMRITRYKYNEGLRRARDNGMQGVEAAMGNNIGFQATKAITNKTLQFTYGNVDHGSGDLQAFEAQLKQVVKNSNSDKGWFANDRANYNQVKAGDYSNIDFPITLQDGTTFDNAEQLASLRNQSQQSSKALKSLYFLPMPNEFSYAYNASWDNKFKMGTMARVLDNPLTGVAQMGFTGIGSGLFNAIGQYVKPMVGKFFSGIDEQTNSGIKSQEVAGAFFKGATNPLGSTDSLNTTNTLGLAGLAPNENAITMFSKMQNRSFSLTFEFLARDEEEANNIDMIINGFKTGMHPTTTPKGTGGVLGFPDIFMLEPWFSAVDSQGNIIPNGTRHPMMPRSKLVALTSLNVNTAPSNNFVTTRDGRLPFQTVTMEFSETTALTQSDLETGTF